MSIALEHFRFISINKNVTLMGHFAYKFVGSIQRYLNMRLLIILLLPLMMAFQEIPPERRVMRTHPNGKEHVVLYLDTQTGELVKEEVFFANGKMQWTGTYKKNIENGTWQFYYENGRIKTIENYLGGKEHGVSSFYDESGKKTKEEFWKHGKLIKEVKY
jgi:hypothetical protein